MFHLFVPAEPGKSIHPNFDLNKYELTNYAIRTIEEFREKRVVDYDLADKIIKVIMLWVDQNPNNVLKFRKLPKSTRYAFDFKSLLDKFTSVMLPIISATFANITTNPKKFKKALGAELWTLYTLYASKRPEQDIDFREDNVRKKRKLALTDLPTPKRVWELKTPYSPSSPAYSPTSPPYSPSSSPHPLLLPPAPSTKTQTKANPLFDARLHKKGREVLIKYLPKSDPLSKMLNDWERMKWFMGKKGIIRKVDKANECLYLEECTSFPWPMAFCIPRPTKPLSAYILFSQKTRKAKPKITMKELGELWKHTEPRPFEVDAEQEK